VQGRNAGTFTRFLSFVIDKGLVTGFGLLGILVVTRLIQLIPADTFDVVDEALDTNQTAKENAFEVVTMAEAEQQQEEDETLIKFGLVLPVFVMNLLAFIVDAISMAAVGRTAGETKATTPTFNILTSSF
jgi:threonine dehydrogenase-like Zn-dependent dehydrogenase